MQITAKQIAEILNGSISGNPDAIITGPSKIEDGKPGTITFLANPKYKDYIYTTEASVVLVNKDFEPESAIQPTLIKVDNVYASLAILMENFNSGISIPSGVASTAIIDSTARLGDHAHIDDHVIIKPYVTIGHNARIYGQVFIGDRVQIGNDVTIYPGVKIYHNCVIGDRVIIHANSVIGSDGFGFAKTEDGQYKKIPQTGNVVIENDVEIGSNTVIDRASIGSTTIGQGAKLDNLIQIAHNVQIGHGAAIAAQSGIAGSSTVGRDCIIGGQVGVVGHIQIADGVMIQAQSGVASSVKEVGSKLYGYPAINYQSYLKSYAYFRKLPDMASQLRYLESRVQQLENGKKD
ncbi:MAG: UDP-3-O-(3-hydroxymyristoyl)glucosamine N-acyltransferase [Chitinophagales bacterium]|nr:UDP-3-O-(3-hydroxymyristoyl)glucosamine N-acyltransferase [Chitinophagales bacterium]